MNYDKQIFEKTFAWPRLAPRCACGHHPEMPARFTDAHNHLQDTRLDPHRAELLRSLPAIVSHAVVNGTRESDWPAVAALAREHPWITPSFGLHPWHVNTRTSSWKTALLAHLDANPRAAIGEIGLDRWIEGHDLAAQTECLRSQLAIAAERDLPATIHCIRAWGALADALASSALPARGFLIHAYAGPAEMVPGFVKMGAFFSFSPSFLHERKSAQRETFRQIPADRLLAETDAPDLAPPPDQNPHPLESPDHTPINHPANIATAFHALAQLRATPIEDLRALIATNFTCLFGA